MACGERPVVNFTCAVQVAGATAALDSMTVAEQAPPTLAAAVPLAAPSNDGAGFFDELPEQPTEEASDFFENLSSQPLSPLAVAGGHAAMDDLPPNSPGVMEPGESDVLKSLYTGDYENAVAACVKVITDAGIVKAPCVSLCQPSRI